MSSKVFGYRREIISFSIHSPIRYYFGQMDRTQCIQSGSDFYCIWEDISGDSN